MYKIWHGSPSLYFSIYFLFKCHEESIKKTIQKQSNPVKKKLSKVDMARWLPVSPFVDIDRILEIIQQKSLIISDSLEFTTKDPLVDLFREDHPKVFSN